MEVISGGLATASPLLPLVKRVGIHAALFRDV